MTRFRSWLTVAAVLMLAVLFPVRVGHTKAAYKDKKQMIETAQAIAIVEITNIEKAAVKGNPWTYQQKASAKVEKVLKGKLPDKVALYGDETFICARCHFEKGRYLVFLDHDGELLTGNNWQLSVRKITGDTKAKNTQAKNTQEAQVEWFDVKNLFERPKAPLNQALKKISDVLGKATVPLLSP